MCKSGVFITAINFMDTVSLEIGIESKNYIPSKSKVYKKQREIISGYRYSNGIDCWPVGNYKRIIGSTNWTDEGFWLVVVMNTFRKFLAVGSRKLWVCPIITVLLYTKANGDKNDIALEVLKLTEQNKVMIFSKSYCCYCTKAKLLLDYQDVKYKAIELNELPHGKDIQEYLTSQTGQRTVPYVFVNGKLLGGCDTLTAAIRDKSFYELLNNWV